MQGTLQRYIHTTIKMSLASLISILIAELFNLEYAITAGILAVLSVQLTRKDSTVVAFKRFTDAILALILSSLLFVLLGYNVYSFTLFTIIFIALSFTLNIQIGIVPSLVLASHLLLYGSFNFSLVINGLLLIGIAIAVTLILNLVYPLNIKKSMQHYIDSIDNLIKKEITLLADYLSDAIANDTYHRMHLSHQQTIENILEKAKLVDKDILFAKDHMPMSYIFMRHAQMLRLSRLFDLRQGLTGQHLHALVLSDYMRSLSIDIGLSNKAKTQLDKLKTLILLYKEKPLPKTRVEFETRSTLYQMLFEIEAFLNEKIQFHERYTD